MTRPKPPVGSRRLLAWTCRGCGRLEQGDAPRRSRAAREHPYVDQRCKACRWRHLEDSGSRVGRAVG